MTNRRPLTIKTPADLLAVVPFVLGFHPEDSLVLLTTDTDARQLHARIDLPEDAADIAEMTSQLLPAVRRSQARRVALVVYGDDHCLALEVTSALETRLADEGVRVVGALRADGERWYSLDGCDDDCCPPEGTPYDVRAHPVTAQGVLDGRVTYRSRRDLADSLIGADPEATEAVAEAADEAMRRFRASGRTPLGSPELGSPDADGPRRHLVAEGQWLRSRIARYVATREPLDAEEAGRLVVALVNIEVRDVAWAAITRADSRAHVELWRDLLRRTPLDLAAAPAGLLAFAAWLSGDGALAWCALERCQEAEPDYNLARLLTEALTAAIDPSTWQCIKEGDLSLFSA